MHSDELLERALLVALAVFDERDLVLLWRAAREAPDHAPAEVAGLSPGARAWLRALERERAPAREVERAQRLGFELVP